MNDILLVSIGFCSACLLVVFYIVLGKYCAAENRKNAFPKNCHSCPVKIKKKSCNSVNGSDACRNKLLDLCYEMQKIKNRKKL